MMYIDDQWCRMGLVFRILQLCGDIAHHSTTVRTLRIFHCLFQASSEDSQCISSFGVGVTQELIWGDVMHLELSKVLKRVKRVRLSEVQISAQICGALQSALRTPHRGRRHEKYGNFKLQHLNGDLFGWILPKGFKLLSSSYFGLVKYNLYHLDSFRTHAILFDSSFILIPPISSQSSQSELAWQELDEEMCCMVSPVFLVNYMSHAVQFMWNHWPTAALCSRVGCTSWHAKLWIVYSWVASQCIQHLQHTAQVLWNLAVQFASILTSFASGDALRRSFLKRCAEIQAEHGKAKGGVPVFYGCSEKSRCSLLSALFEQQNKDNMDNTFTWFHLHSLLSIASVCIRQASLANLQSAILPASNWLCARSNTAEDGMQMDGLSRFFLSAVSKMTCWTEWPNSPRET